MSADTSLVLPSVRIFDNPFEVYHSGKRATSTPQLERTRSRRPIVGQLTMSSRKCRRAGQRTTPVLEWQDIEVVPCYQDDMMACLVAQSAADQ
jgi:hypothetical protein